MSLGTIEKLKKSPKIKSIKINEKGAAFITWSKVEGAEKYAVKRCAELGGDYETVEWVKKCEYTDSTIERDTNYWYKITAWKKLEGKKTSTKTSAVKAVVSSEIPKVEDVVLSAGKKTAITIKWKNKYGADGCVINRRNDFYKQILPVETVKGESFVDNGIVSGQIYHYSLQYFIQGEKVRYGNFSQEFDYIHLDSGKILSFKGKYSKKFTANLRLVAGADGYILLRSDKEKGEYTEVARTTSGLDLTVSDKVESRFKNYYYITCAYKFINGKEFLSVYSKPISKKGK